MEPQERVDLSLKLLKHPKDTKELPMVRRIEVAEISSNLGNDQRIRPIQKAPDRIYDINRTTRIAKKMLSVQVSWKEFEKVLLIKVLLFYKSFFHFEHSNWIIWSEYPPAMTMLTSPVHIICLEIIICGDKRHFEKISTFYNQLHHQ